MAKLEINVDVKPRGIASAYVDAPFDKGKEALESHGYNVISLEQNARLRMQEGKDFYVSRNGNWVREGVICVPKKGKFLTKVSPIMTKPKEATNCQRNGRNFYLTDEQVKQALENSVLLSANSVPTNRFGECDTTVYAFGNSAEDYGNFLRDTGIKEMPIWTTGLQEKPFVRQQWFDGLDSRSVFDSCRNLGYNSRVRGINIDSEGTAPKNLETPKKESKSYLVSKPMSSIRL